MSLENSPKWVQEQVRTWLEIDKKINVKEAIDQLSTEALITFFEKHSTAKFSKKDPETPENSAAHIVAYQKALNLLGIDVKIDGMYGSKTRDALIKFQTEQKIAKPNGIPGEKTVEKLIEALKWKLPKTVEKPVPKVRETIEQPETPLEKVDKYLKGEGYTQDNDGNYIGPDKDFTITIQEGKAEYTRTIGRAFGSWGLSDKESLNYLEVQNILGITKNTK